MKFIITDWMNNICFDTENHAYKSFDEASEYLDRMIEEELAMDGLNPYGECADILEGYTRNATEKDFQEYRDEYFIHEYNPTTERLIWVGNRYVLKQDYYKVI